MGKNYCSAQELEKLLEVIERNRQENIRNSRHEFAGLYSSSFEEDCSDDESGSDDNLLKPQDVKLLIFGAQSPFLTSVAQTFSSLIVLALFHDQEKCINFALEYTIKHLLVDLDNPTNCFHSINIFSALKTLSPDIKVYACTDTQSSDEACRLKHKGATIIGKPLWRKQIEDFIRKYLND